MLRDTSLYEVKPEPVVGSNITAVKYNPASGWVLLSPEPHGPDWRRVPDSTGQFFTDWRSVEDPEGVEMRRGGQWETAAVVSMIVVLRDESGDVVDIRDWTWARGGCPTPERERRTQVMSLADVLRVDWQWLDRQVGDDPRNCRVSRADWLRHIEREEDRKTLLKWEYNAKWLTHLPIGQRVPELALARSCEPWYCDNCRSTQDRTYCPVCAAPCGFVVEDEDDPDPDDF